MAEAPRDIGHATPPGAHRKTPPRREDRKEGKPPFPSRRVAIQRAGAGGLRRLHCSPAARGFGAGPVDFRGTIGGTMFQQGGGARAAPAAARRRHLTPRHNQSTPDTEEPSATCAPSLAGQIRKPSRTDFPRATDSAHEDRGCHATGSPKRDGQGHGKTRARIGSCIAPSKYRERKVRSRSARPECVQNRHADDRLDDRPRCREARCAGSAALVRSRRTAPRRRCRPGCRGQTQTRGQRYPEGAGESECDPPASGHC